MEEVKSDIIPGILIWNQDDLIYPDPYLLIDREEIDMENRKIRRSSFRILYPSIMKGLIAGIVSIMIILILLLFGLSLKVSLIMVYMVALLLSLYIAFHLIRRVHIFGAIGRVLVIGFFILLISLLLVVE